jgi:hypothetical protein
MDNTTTTTTAGTSPAAADAGRVALIVCLPVAFFRAALVALSPAMSSDVNRHVLNGIFIHLSEGVVNLVATDGRRLAKLACPVFAMTDCPDDACGFIPAADVPKILKGVLSKSAAKAGGFVSFSLANPKTERDFNSGLYSLGSFTGYSPNSGRFPIYDQVIPEKKALNRPVDVFGLVAGGLDYLELFKFSEARAAAAFDVFLEKQNVQKGSEGDLRCRPQAAKGFKRDLRKALEQNLICPFTAAGGVYVPAPCRLTVEQTSIASAKFDLVKPAEICGAFNPYFLADLDESLKALAPFAKGSPSAEMKDEKSPLRLDWQGTCGKSELPWSFTFVLMPQRIG